MLDALHNRFVLAGLIVVGGFIIVSTLVGIWAAIFRAKSTSWNGIRMSKDESRRLRER